MVWFHGGAFEAGSAHADFPRTTILAADGATFGKYGDDIVFVTVNYRLGPFGFLAHPGLDESHGNPGSYGLLDQLESLRWVKANIEEFGGDPNNVTIFGESSGGMGVCQMLVAPESEAENLFQRAIIQSGPCTPFSRDVAMAHGVGRAYDDFVALIARSAGGLGSAECDGALADPTDAKMADCLRAVEAGVLARAHANSSLFELVAVNTVSWLPPAGTNVIPDFPLRLFEAGAFHRVPILVGTNAAETGKFPHAATPGMQGEWSLWVNLTAEQLDDLLEYYETNLSLDQAQASVQLNTDLEWTCPTRFILSKIVAAGHADAWLYSYEHGREDASVEGHTVDGSGDGSGFTWIDDITVPAGPSHGAELVFLFGHDGVPGLTDEPIDALVAEAMQRSWTRFADVGQLSIDDPPHDIARWTEDGLDSARYASDNGGDGLDSAYRVDRCDVIEAVAHWDCSCIPGSRGCPRWCEPADDL